MTCSWLHLLKCWSLLKIRGGSNRFGHEVYNAAELKTMQEVITLTVFAFFSVFYLGERLTLNHLVGFGFIGLGAFFVFKGPLH